MTMRNICSLILLLIVILLPVFAGVEVSDSKILTAYKYTTSSIFATDPTLESNFRVLDVDSIERESSYNFLFDDSDISRSSSDINYKKVFATYIIHGNLKSTFDISFTFTPLTMEQESVNKYYPYTITIVPAKTRLDNTNWPTVIDHAYNGTTYRFSYSEGSTDLSERTINVNTSSSANLTISYIPTITVSPSNCPPYNIIDSWIRYGTIAITLPSDISEETAPPGTYTATMTIQIGGE